MRWLFLFLFLLNLAYVGWEISKSSSENYADVPALKNVKRILLLSELKQSAKLPEAKTSLVSNTHTESLAVQQTDFEKVAEKAAEQVVEKKATKNEPIETESAKVESAKKTPIKTSAINLSQTAKCFTLGPFRDLGKLRGFAREIKSYVVETDFRGREEREQSLYWVYIKPEKNQVKAIETGKRLKAKKIKDFYVIRDGEKINGLSLGYFKSKNGAYGLAKKVKNLGFGVIVEPVFKTYTLYWLDYQVVSGANIPESIFDKHIKQTKKNNISRLSRGCSA